MPALADIFDIRRSADTPHPDIFVLCHASAIFRQVIADISATPRYSSLAT